MTIGSVFMTLEALKKIKNTISAINPAYVAHIQPKALVTLIVEHFNSKMREVYEVPTVMQFAYQFPDAVEETVKRTTNCGFSYFTIGTVITRFQRTWCRLSQWQRYQDQQRYLEIEKTC